MILFQFRINSTNVRILRSSVFGQQFFHGGNRKTIINKANELVALMDGEPYHFILNHSPKDRRRFEGFKHRTFQYTDTLYFLEFFQDYYNRYASLEHAFTIGLEEDDTHVGKGLVGFSDLFFGLPHFPSRTKKHIADPRKNSTCKRINMFFALDGPKRRAWCRFRIVEQNPTEPIAYSARCTCRAYCKSIGIKKAKAE